jgi:lysophospholipase L1-like esterase
MRVAFIGDSLTEGIPGSSYVAILCERLPGHTLINLGEGNDTAVSLYRRLARLRFDGSFDIAFLWVGVNDLSGAVRWPFRLANALLRKPRSKDVEEFRHYYRATLDLLCGHARRVIAVAPLLKGEDTANLWNRELEVLSSAVAELASCYEQVEYLDLRPAFAARLAGRPISDYLPRSVVRVALDALTLRSREQIDRKAAERGLHVTLDGIHLNGAGAEIVAEMFLQAIFAYPAPMC